MTATRGPAWPVCQIRRYRSRASSQRPAETSASGQSFNRRAPLGVTFGQLPKLGQGSVGLPRHFVAAPDPKVAVANHFGRESGGLAGQRESVGRVRPLMPQHQQAHFQIRQSPHRIRRALQCCQGSRCLRRVGQLDEHLGPGPMQLRMRGQGREPFVHLRECRARIAGREFQPDPGQPQGGIPRGRAHGFLEPAAGLVHVAQTLCHLGGQQPGRGFLGSKPSARSQIRLGCRQVAAP